MAEHFLNSDGSSNQKFSLSHFRFKMLLFICYRMVLDSVRSDRYFKFFLLFCAVLLDLASEVLMKTFDSMHAFFLVLETSRLESFWHLGFELFRKPRFQISVYSLVDSRWASWTSILMRISFRLSLIGILINYFSRRDCPMTQYFNRIHFETLGSKFSKTELKTKNEQPMPDCQAGFSMTPRVKTNEEDIQTKSVFL